MYPKSIASWLNYFSQCTRFHETCDKKQSTPPVIMISPKDDGQAHQISVTRPVFEYLGELLRTAISFQLSTRHNAMYGFDDMYRVLTMMCTNKASDSSEAGALSDLQDSGKAPPSRWVLGKIRGIGIREIREQCDHAIKRKALDMKKVGMSRNPVVVAIDEHLVGWYGKGSDSQYITRLSRKTGRASSIAWLRCTAWPADPGPRLGPDSSRKQIMVAMS